MYKPLRVKTKNKKDNVVTEKSSEQRFFCFSKKIVVSSFIVTVLLIVTTVLGTLFTDKDMSTLGTLAGTFVAELSIVIGGYLWKAKSENKIKLINQLIKDNADKYGIDAVIQLAGIVLSDT